MNKSEQMGFMTQFPVKKDVASWRQEEVTLSGNELKTIHFSDTMPNMFCIQNPNDIHLLTGITKIPTLESYETRIEPNSTMTFGRPVPTRTLNILNPSNKSVTISLFSVNDKFDISILQYHKTTLEGFGDIVNDGIIKGFSDGVELPYGTNHIGIVSLDSLPSGTKTIGKVNFGDASVTLINEIINSLTDLRKGIIDFLSYERIATTQSVVIDFNSEPFLPDYIHYIANDGLTNIAVSVTFVNGNTKTFTLTNGDVFGDIKASIANITITPKTTNDTISWRVLVGKRG